jgi:hypothetical protein
VIYRPIPGCPDYYGGTDGSIVSALSGKTLKLQPNKKSGHLQVWIYSLYRYAHTLIAAAYLGERPEGLEVCHDNGNPQDNRPCNLYYGTHSQNMLDQVRHGTHRWSKLVQ